MTILDIRGNAHDTTGRFAEKHQPAANFDLATFTPADRTSAFIEAGIERGDFSPAARGMDPRQVIDQHAEANALDWATRAQMYDQADLKMQGTPGDLADGDLVDLEPLVVAYRKPAYPLFETCVNCDRELSKDRPDGGWEHSSNGEDACDSGDPERDPDYFAEPDGDPLQRYESDLIAAESELATVQDVHEVRDPEDDRDVRIISTDLLNLAVPHDAVVTYRPNIESHCAECGVSIAGDGRAEGGLCEEHAQEAGLLSERGTRIRRGDVGWDEG